MNNELIDFIENYIGKELPSWQKDFCNKCWEYYQKGEIFYFPKRMNYKSTLLYLQYLSYLYEDIKN